MAITEIPATTVTGTARPFGAPSFSMAITTSGRNTHTAVMGMLGESIIMADIGIPVTMEAATKVDMDITMEAIEITVEHGGHWSW